MGLGGGGITLALIAIRTFQRLDVARYGEPVSDASLDLLAGLVAGIVIAALFGWRRSQALDNVWQRGVIAVLAVVGALLVAFLLATPFWHFFGVPGLVVLAAANVAFGIAGSRWATRGSGKREAGSGKRGGETGSGRT